MITHYGSAPDRTRPEAVDRVGDHTLEQNIKHTIISDMTDHFYVTSEARGLRENAS